MYEKRWFQEEAIAAPLEYYSQGNKGNCVIALPTGTGKSFTMAETQRRFMSMFAGQRFINLTHVQELVDGNAQTMRDIWPNAPVGVFSAGLKRKDTAHDIIYGSIQSVANCVEMFGWRDLCFIDEAHLVSPNDDTRYQFTIEKLRSINPNMKVIGYSATPYRLGQGMITDSGLFDDVIYDCTSRENFNRLIEEGYLAPVVARPTDIKLDSTGIHISNGDFVQSEVERAVDAQHILEPALRETVAWFLHEKRRSGLVFVSSVKHVDEAVAILNAMGLPTVGVHSKMSPKQRTANILAWLANEVAFAVNQNVLTVGINNPFLDLIADIQLTTSTGKHVQKWGRGTRPFDWFKLSPKQQERYARLCGHVKINCRGLDFVGNVPRLGPINDPVIPKRKGDKGGVAPIKICETEKLVQPEFGVAIGCGGYNHASARYCDECGAQFKLIPKVYDQAGTDEIIRGTQIPESDAPQVETFPVDNVFYTRQEVKGNKAMLKATYQCGLRSFTELKGFENDRNPH
jgi:DNA repair protein RadD